MISTRYAPALCGLIALALVPVVIHSYAGATAPDGRTARTIPAILGGFVGQPSARDAGWGKRRFESDDWIERRYTAAGDEVVFTIIRSYDLKRLYHHPELDVAYGTSLPVHRVVYWPDRPDIPVHVNSSPVKRALAMYALHYGDRFISDPIRFQIRTAGELLFSRRKPMTLFFVHDLVIPEKAEATALPSAKLLFGAIDAFLAQPVR